MHKYNYFTALFLLFVTCFTGCGQKQEPKTEEEPFNFMEEVVEEEEDDFDRTGLTWENTKWVNPITVDSQKRLYVENYQRYEWISSEDRRSFDAYYGSVFYKMDEAEEGEIYDYIIEGYDAENNTASRILLNNDILFDGATNSFVEDLCVKNDNEIILLTETIEEDRLTGLETIHIDMEGNIQKRADLYDAFVESEVRDVTDLSQWKHLRQLPLSIESLDDSHYFLTVGTVPLFLIMNEDGSLYQVITDALAPDSSEKHYYVLRSKMGDGRMLLWVTENLKLSDWYAYDLEKGFYKITKFDNFQDHGRFALTQDGYCYLTNSSWLYRWDIFTGKSIKIMNLENEAIAVNSGILRVVLQENGLPILYNNKGEYLEAYKLTEQKPDTSNYFTVVSFSDNCKELEAACADYTRTHPGNGIWVEKPTKDLDTYRTKLLAEMVAGRGPDAMYVTPADMKMFYEKGVLEDMTGCLSPELEKQIFKGVLDCGKVDGKQIGFPLTAKLSAMLVDRSLWDKDSWNLQDMQNLIREGKIPNLKMIVMLDPLAWKGPTYHQGVLEALILKDLNNTPFLNLEEGICNFDSPEFIKLLELCKEYPQTIEVGYAYDNYQEGNLLGYIGDVSDIQEFSYTMMHGGETSQCVGFPSERGSGCYWECDYLLVIRKGFDKKDVIKELVEILYSVNNQRKLVNTVNRTVFDLYLEGPTLRVIDETNELKNCYNVHSGDMYFYGFAGKKNGDSWLAEYLELADKAVPLPHVADVPAQIVREEAKEFFSGNKDAASVAKIIQSRVKLWMMEKM